MNTRQSGAYRELIQLEERTRERWYRSRGLPMPGERGSQPGQRVNERGLSVAEGTRDPIQYIPDGPAHWQRTQPAAGASFQPAAATYQPGLSFGSRSGTYLPPGPAGSLPLPDSAIYKQAIRVSSPRVMEASEANGGPRCVVRQVEVPVTRQVKVPVRTQAFVNVEVEVPVRTKRLVQEQFTQLEPEEYYDVVYRPVTKQKEIWVKRTVPVRTMEAVAVPKVRHVPRQATRVRAVDDWELQTRTEQRPVSVPAYRVDEVTDSQLVEVEEEHDASNPFGPASANGARVVGARQVGLLQGVRHQRTKGQEAFHPHDPRHAHIDEDEQAHLLQQQLRRTLPPRAFSAAQLGRSMGSNPYGRSLQLASPTGSHFGRTGVPGGDESTLGMRLRDGTDALGTTRGALVVSVARDSPAERAGVRMHDLLAYANNKPTRSVVELRDILTNSFGPVVLQARRRGGNKLTLNVQR